MCHDSFIFVPWLIQMCAMTHSNVCRDVCEMKHSYDRGRCGAQCRQEHSSYMCHKTLTHMCAMTHPYACHDSFRYATGLIYLCHDKIRCATWLIRDTRRRVQVTHMDSWHMCHMIHSYVFHDSFISVPWRNHLCAMTHSYACHHVHVVWRDTFLRQREMRRALQVRVFKSYVRHDSFMCAMSHSDVCHDSFICVPWRVWRVTWHILTTEGDAARNAGKSSEVKRYVPPNAAHVFMCDVTHSCVCHDSLICVPRPIHMCAMTHYNHEVRAT